MRPLDDWMELELWEDQKAKLDVQIALPDSVDKAKDDNALFRVVNVANDDRVKVGDIVLVYGAYLQRIKLPRGDVMIGRAQDVCFIIEESDLTKESA
mgnify:CR=1 FL=1